MFSATRIRVVGIALAVFAAIALDVGMAAGQAPGWNGPMPSLYPAPEQFAVPQPGASPPPSRAASRGPLARLVRNPDASQGLPPFALTDQGGTVQRYVEPVPGIDLEAYVDQVIIVRHDTGRTLLATQLELPPQPIYPLLGEVDGHSQPSMAGAKADVPQALLSRRAIVQPAQFVDDDDASVQLLPEGQDVAADESGGVLNGSIPASGATEFTTSDQWYPEFPGPMMPGEVEGIAAGPLLGDSIDCQPELYESYPADVYGSGGCPECGGYHPNSECGPRFGSPFGPAFDAKQSKPCSLFADFEINFLRTHLPETAAGKLSEKYEFSPRLIIGFRDTGMVDGRIRYWTYGRDTRVLGDAAIRVDFDVLDLEGTHAFVGRHSEVTVGAGTRLASIDLVDDDAEVAGADLIGMTLSAQGRTPLHSSRRGGLAVVYGGRLSLLAGDWGGDPDSDFIGGLVQDDNVVVHELHAGVDYTCCYRDAQLHARLGFEMQNWHSDAFSQNAGTDSIAFLGPGLQFGAEF